MIRKILRGVLIFFGAVVVGIVGYVIYVYSTYKRDFSSTPLPDIKASTDKEVIARGRYIAHGLAHCSACHGPAEKNSEHQIAQDNLDDLRGGYEMKAGPFGTFRPANLTSDPETGIAGLTDPQLARIIRHGVAPDGRLDVFMAFAVGPMADEDLTALISYLRSLPPTKNPVAKDEWGFVAKALAGKFNPKMLNAPKFVKEGGISRERGEYLANGPAACFGCHSPFDVMAGLALVGPAFSGEFEPEPDPTDPDYEIIAPNLTKDPKTGFLGTTDEDQFVARIKAGRKYKGSKMPWENFSQNMTEDDVRSIYRYIASLPPTERGVGPSRRKKGEYKMSH